MSMEATRRLMVRTGRVKHVLKENRKIQAKYKIKTIPHEHKYMGSTVKVGFEEQIMIYSWGIPVIQRTPDGKYFRISLDHYQLINGYAEKISFQEFIKSTKGEEFETLDLKFDKI